MKVDRQEPTSSSGQAKSSPDAERFKKALEEADARNTPPKSQRATSVLPAGARMRPTQPPPLARASGPVLASQRGALSSPESLGLKRQAMHAEVQRLGTVRGEAQAQGHAHTEHRLHDLIARELSKELRAPLPALPEVRPHQGPPAPDSQRPLQEPPGQDVPTALAVGAANAGAQAEDASPALRAEAAMALIERIEVFVKSQRPALSMSLRGHLDATVEVERTGPREVSLRIQGRSRPVAAEDLGRLRDALEARGLKLSALRAE